MSQIATLTSLPLLLLLPAGSLCLDVIVVGAGISGLTAGRTLQQQGHSVTLLEADPERYGGKIWTRTDLVPQGTRKLLPLVMFGRYSTMTGSREMWRQDLDQDRPCSRRHM